MLNKKTLLANIANKKINLTDCEKKYCKTQ